MTTTQTEAAPSATVSAVGRLVTPTGRLVLPSTAHREDWLYARRQGITATDVPKIVGASPYGSALDVYADKIGEPFGDDDLSEAGVWGTVFEDAVAREWAGRAGVTVRRVGLIANADRPWQMASLDRLVSGCPAGGRCAVEVKTRNAWVAGQWADGIPDAVAVQVLTQLDVSGLDHIHVAALIGGQTLVEHTVEPDEVTIAYLREESERVWRAVQEQTPPEVDPALLSVELLDRYFPDRAGVVDVDHDEVTRWLAEYRAQGLAETAAKKAKAAAKVRLLALLGDGEEARAGGEVLYTYRQGKPTTTVPADNIDRLREFPDAFAACAVTKDGTRAIAITTAGKAVAAATTDDAEVAA